METNFSKINNNSINVFSNLTNSTIENIFNSTKEIKQPEEHLNFLSAKTLIAIIILLVHTIASPIFEKFHFHYIHESGISMLLGMIVGLVSIIVSPNVRNDYNFVSLFFINFFENIHDFYNIF